jgi:transcriptional regulator with XRE-family HTH domain
LSDSSLHNISNPPFGKEIKPKFNGLILKELREKAGLTLRGLSGEIYRRFNYYYTPQAIDLAEKGESQPKGHNLIILARFFGVEESFFYEALQSEEIPRDAGPEGA